MVSITAGRPYKVLCWDLENKPGTYGPGDYTHPKVTAVGAKFVGEERVYSWCLNRSKPGQVRDAAAEFRAMWSEAGTVMGHNIRRHDVRVMNGFLVSQGLPILEPRRTVDTFRDTPRTAGLSRSLENLCARWGCPLEKVNMTEYDWEQAYDGIPWAVEKMRLRVTVDVEMNVWLFLELQRRGLL